MDMIRVLEFTVCLCVGLGSLTGTLAVLVTPPVSHVNETTVKETVLAEVTCSTQRTVLSCVCVLESTPHNGAFQIRNQNTSAGQVHKSADFSIVFWGQSRPGFQLNASLVNQYRIDVRCYNDSFESSSSLVVFIVPNHPPVVSQQSIGGITNVDVNTAINTAIYNVSATDPENDILSYVMTEDPPNGYFHLDKWSGQIRVARDLTLVPDTTVACKIDVYDGYNSVPITVLLRLTNQRVPPIFGNLPAAIRINEGIKNNELILQIDVDAPVQAWWVQPSKERSIFEFDNKTNEFRFTRAQSVLLDYESGVCQIIITFVASNGSLQSQGQLIIDVINVHEPPVFTADVYYCILEESQAFGSSCMPGINATSPENNSEVKLSLVKSAFSDNFVFIANSGLITFAVDYDVDNNNKNQRGVIKVLAKDVVGLTADATVNIYVRDFNDNICDEVLYDVIDRDTPVGLRKNFLPEDNDLTSPNKDLQFELISGDTTHFALLPNGSIWYSRLFPDSEFGRTFFLSVRCVDRGNPPMSATTMYIVYYNYTKPDEPEWSLWDEEEFIAVFTILMALLALLALALILLLCKCCCREKARVSEKAPRNPKKPTLVKEARPQNPEMFREETDFFRTQKETSVNPAFKNISWSANEGFDLGVQKSLPESKATNKN